MSFWPWLKRWGALTELGSLEELILINVNLNQLPNAHSRVATILIFLIVDVKRSSL
jgi:hypothetical protein